MHLDTQDSSQPDTTQDCGVGAKCTALLDKPAPQIDWNSPGSALHAHLKQQNGQGKICAFLHSKANLGWYHIELTKHSPADPWPHACSCALVWVTELSRSATRWSILWYLKAQRSAERQHWRHNYLMCDWVGLQLRTKLLFCFILCMYADYTSPDLSERRDVALPAPHRANCTKPKKMSAGQAERGSKLVFGGKQPFTKQDRGGKAVTTTKAGGIPIAKSDDPWLAHWEPKTSSTTKVSFLHVSTRTD